MIARLCLPAIAAGMFLCGPSTAQTPTATPSGSPSGQSAPVAGGNQDQAADDKKGSAPGVPVLNAAKPPKDQDGGRNHANAQDGVGAGEHQQANNEEKLVNLTFWLVIATIILMAATVGLWLETRKLAAQAKEASKDTKRSIDIAERAATETARAAQAAVDALGNERAWVTPGPIMPKFEPNLMDEFGNSIGSGFGFSLKWINTGRTPALRLGIAVNYTVLQMGEALPELDRPFDAGPRNTILGPNTEHASGFVWISGERFSRFKNREARVIILSQVEYSTVNHPNETFRTKICLDIKYLGMGIDIFGKPIPELDATLVGEVPMMS